MNSYTNSNTINKVDKYPQKGIVSLIEFEELCKIKDCTYLSHSIAHIVLKYKNIDMQKIVTLTLAFAIILGFTNQVQAQKKELKGQI